MFSPAIRKPKEVKLRKLNMRQDLFCRLYATDPHILGNATQAYMLAYGSENYMTSASAAKHMLDKPHITAKINEYIQQEGFNNENVDKQHLFLINQHKDLNVKMKGIEHYNKLKKRVENKLEIIMPKPIMEWDEEEDTIHKIDKSKAKDIDNTA